MPFSPSLNTPAVLSSTYTNSPKGLQQSFSTRSYGIRDAYGSSYKRVGEARSRDNWILGKGANIHDGWDGWSVVQGEKRYWDSKLGKPEFRGKCGGAAANRLSEEKIIRKQGMPSQDASDVPDGLRRTDVLREQRREKIAALSDELFREYFPDLTQRKLATASPASSSPRSPRLPLTPRRGASSRRSPKRSDSDEACLTNTPNHTSKVIRGRGEQMIPDPPQRVPIAPSSPNGSAHLGASQRGGYGMAPAGMPTNGPLQQPLPPVPASPRRVDFMHSHRK